MVLLVVLINLTAGLGFGAIVMRILNIDKEISPGEHWTISIAIGFGVIGWLVFPIGITGLLSVWVLWIILFLGSLGSLLLRDSGFPVFEKKLDSIGKAILILVCLSLSFDLAEALAPPFDADSLAYHFNWPKQFIGDGVISFIPQAWTGAVPMLVQMTYIPPLAIGGEAALTLWTMVASWLPAALVFVLSRRHLSLNWSLAIALIYLTTPAVVYGGGSGQVEPKMTLFVMVGAWSLAKYIETHCLSFVLLSGLAAGFFAGSKYMGLLFVAAIGLVILFRSGELRKALIAGMAFGFAAIVGGFQWYAWNTFNTGDPVFPMFFEWLGQNDLGYWSESYSRWFKENIRLLERDVPRSLWWLIAYPFKATFDPLVLFESRRPGFGPWGMLVLPFAVFGAWKLQDQIRNSRLFTYAIVCGLFYVLWFFTGSSQRVRHLLPVLPLFLVVLTVAAVRFINLTSLKSPMLAAIGITLIIQLVGQGIYSLSFLKHLVSNNTRTNFLSNNVVMYDVVPWINSNIGPLDRIFLTDRQVFYYLKVPYFFGSPNVQALVELREGRVQKKPLYLQLRSVGVTHVLLKYGLKSSEILTVKPWQALKEMGCLVSLKKFKLRTFKSRTLPELSINYTNSEVFKFNDQKCPQR